MLKSAILLLFGSALLTNVCGDEDDIYMDFLTESNHREIPEMTVPQLIKYWGYPVEEHWVTTEDGYILGLHRIPDGKDGLDVHDEPRPVVYMQHPLTASSGAWVFGPPTKSLGFILADQGYDVWMSNSRGNTYSRNHTYLDPCALERCKEFWDFDWHEGGLYDVSAGIDFVLKSTGMEQVYYIGHSMGTTQYLVLLSSRPEYNEKIKLGVLLAPPAYMSHASNPIFDIAVWAGDVEILYHLFGFYEFLPHYDIISWFAHSFCGDAHPLTSILCTNIGFLILGFNPGELNGTMIPTYLDHIPEGTSTRTFTHYAQLFLSENFESYDFGEAENLRRYNQTTPLQYQLEKVTAPTAIFKGDHDSLVSLDDVEILVNRLPNVVFDHLVEITGWTHTSYIIATNADQLIYKYVVDLLEEY